MRRWFAGFVACGLMAGCSFGADEEDAPPVVTMGLVSFDACDDALEYLKSEARERVRPYGLDDEVLVTEGFAAAEDDAAGSASEPAHSTTNVQEIGVDEPDIVKTDGRLIVTVSGADLRVVDVSDGTPRAVGRLALRADSEEYVDAELLLAGDRALVLMRDNSWIAYDDGDAVTSSEDIAWPQPHEPSTTVLLVDLSDPSAPTIASTLHIDGTHVDARMMEDTVRLVVSSRPGISFPMTEDDWGRDEDDLIERNREVIAESTLEDWLPSYQLTSGDDESSGLLVECEQLDRPADFSGFATLSVLTLDLPEDPADGLSDGDAVGVLTDGDTLYASTDRLYVATTRWGDPMPMDAAMIMPRPGEETTGIHAFDIGSGGPARYVASGEIDGRIIGRYAMSEHEGILRVATTEQAGQGTQTTESRLVTLQQRGDELVQVGAVGGLGKGEEIYAVRYIGTTGYVVTFRQVDPLYVLDLSDPAAPAVTGELKITGYSAYLHDVGDGRLVGVGQEATTDGRTVGAQVSLFDVGDPAAPAKLDGHVVPDAWTDAEWDPHAFLYWAETDQLVVPLQAETRTGALVLRVGDDSVTEQGVVGRSDDAARADYPWMTRSLVVGDTLYTLWDDGLQANALDDLEPRGWLSLS